MARYEQTFKNSATFAANCCCSKVDWFPCQVKIVDPDWRTKHSVEFNDVATYRTKTGVETKDVVVKLKIKNDEW